MTVESTHRGICDNNEHGAALSIYAQSDGTDMGVLTVSGTTAIEMTNGLTINGGKLTATSTNGQGFRVNYGDIAIHGGEVTGIGSDTQSIFAYDGDVTITGGIVSADQGIMSTEQSGNGGHLTISGGDEKTRYLLGANIIDQKGIVLNTGFNRTALRLNADRRLTDKLTVEAALNVSRNKQGKLIYTLRDNQSITGTFLMNEVLGAKDRVRINEGDIITLGATTLILRIAED
jgi:pSer/pThr/pTyr-binding forkhead associated (FHA) protein